MPQVPEKFLLFTHMVPNYLAVTLVCPTIFGGNTSYIGCRPSTTKVVLLLKIAPGTTNLPSLQIAYFDVVSLELDP